MHLARSKTWKAFLKKRYLSKLLNNAFGKYQFWCKLHFCCVMCFFCRARKELTCHGNPRKTPLEKSPNTPSTWPFGTQLPTWIRSPERQPSWLLSGCTAAQLPHAPWQQPVSLQRTLITRQSRPSSSELLPVMRRAMVQQPKSGGFRVGWKFYSYNSLL